MEVCPEAELIAIENEAALCDGSFEIGEGLEVLVCERLLEGRAQGLGGLEVGGSPGATLLQGSHGWRPGPDRGSRAARRLTRDVRLALQAEPGPTPPHPGA